MSAMRKPKCLGEVMRLEVHHRSCDGQCDAPTLRGQPAKVASEQFREGWERIFGGSQERGQG